MDKYAELELVVKHAESPAQVKLPYVEQGDPSGIPVLLLHGFAGSWRAFELMLSHLPHSIHAVAPTLRGHGDASKPPDGYRIDHFAADVASFMDVLELETAVIVGHSMGSAIAQRFAAKYPEATLGLVLVGACITKPGDPQAQEFWDTTVSQLTDPIDPTFVRRFLESTLAQPVPESFLDTIVQDSLKMPARVWQAIWQGRLEEDGTDDPGRISAPTLIVWGNQDTRCTHSDQEAMKTSIADSRLLVYNGAGHGLHYEEPERFASDLLAFVDDVI